MIFEYELTTETGRIWGIKASLNGFYPESHKNKKAFERAVIDALIEEVTPGRKVERNEDGAPFLVDHPNEFVSISHSKDVFVIYWSKKGTVGVDIQLIERKLEKHMDYFVNQREERFSWTNENLYVLWGAKEAAYKQLRGHVSDYKESMECLEIGTNRMKVKVDDIVVVLAFLLDNDYCLVYTV